MNREEFAKRGINRDYSILEFGPSYSPMYPKQEWENVETVDWAPADILKKTGYTSTFNVERIEEVDYVSSVDYSSYIMSHGGGNYDVIAASHFIEHTLDVVRFLQDCSKLLSSDGMIKLVIPDKRYEFDTFREITSLRTALDVYYNHFSMSNHSLGTLIDEKMSAVYVDEDDVLIPNSMTLYGDLVHFKHVDNSDGIEYLRELIKEYDSNSYEDAHTWVFTPCSFELLIYQLNVLGLIDIRIKDIICENKPIAGVINTCQFFVEMIKGKYEYSSQYLKQLYVAKKWESLEEDCIYFLLSREFDTKQKLFIYGTGNGTRKIVDLLGKMQIEYDGYIVSDGHRKAEYYNDHSVYEVSDLDMMDRDDISIIIGVLNEQYRKEIFKELENKKLRWIF